MKKKLVEEAAKEILLVSFLAYVAIACVSLALMCFQGWGTPLHKFAFTISMASFTSSCATLALLLVFKD